MNANGTSQSRAGFSLVEVVIATGIFATAIVVVIGLLGPMTKRAEDVIDSETAARLTATIQTELERIGFENAVFLTGGAGGTTLIELVATPDASRVRLASGAEPKPADAAPDDLDLPGIPNRDRYFHVTLQQQTGALAYVPGASGALALRADVEWPYWIPEGPASPDPARVDTDPHSVVPPAQRQRLSYFFALRR